MTPEIIDRATLIARYCERQDSTPQDLARVLDSKTAQFTPDGFMLAECQVLDGSRLGQYVILPYGPNNTFKVPPSTPFSPRGLASDMSVVVAISPVTLTTV